MSGVQRQNFIFPDLSSLTYAAAANKDVDGRRFVVTGESTEARTELKRGLIDRTGGSILRRIADNNAQKNNNGVPTAHQASKMVKEKFAAHVREEVRVRYGDEFATKILKGVNISSNHWVDVAQMRKIMNRIDELPPGSVQISKDINDGNLVVHNTDYSLLSDDQRALVRKEVSARVTARADFREGTTTTGTIKGIVQDVLRSEQLGVDWLQKKEDIINNKRDELKHGMPEEWQSKIDAEAQDLKETMRRDEAGPREMEAATMSVKLERMTAPIVKDYYLEVARAQHLDRTTDAHKKAFGKHGKDMPDEEIARRVDDAINSLKDESDPHMQFAKSSNEMDARRNVSNQINYTLGMISEEMRNDLMS